MIPLYKLIDLPRSQQLRKAAKILGMLEHKIINGGQLTAGEKAYAGSLLQFLACDTKFAEPVLEAINAALLIFAGCGIEGTGNAIRRELNKVYHILQAETGRYPSDWDFIGETGVLDSAKRRTFPGMHAYLEDIRSPFNVGSMFRTAESFGIEKLWLSPLCADPRHKRASRTAMGCVDLIPWERFSRDPLVMPTEECNKFSAGPFFALETGGIALEDFTFPQQGILIAGSEELGVSPRALATADASIGRVSITGYGAKGSLNVSVAFGIVMQAWAAFLNRAS